MKRWWGIRHVRWLVLMWMFSRWWQQVGSQWWLIPNEADIAYLDAIWRGEQ